MSQPEDPGYRPYEPPAGGGSPEPTWPPQPAPGQPYGQYGQQYGQYGQYGQSPSGYPMSAASPYGPVTPPDHAQATTVLILGILGLVTCQLISPFAWAMGQRVVREIDRSGGRIGGRSAANAGRVCGIVGSVLLLLAALGTLAVLLLAVASA
ncbi:DUF4190 domain-containing protein [Nocardioides nanhaiensis]|uniref:DUF4190 domain-containing protein n=1 Tax=Nocardioides nanhaiensis TaxID=1476871 RepID=A0ABP8VVU0_9ACTN